MIHSFIQFIRFGGSSFIPHISRMQKTWAEGGEEGPGFQRRSRAEQSRGRDSAVIDGCLGGGVLKVARGGTTCVECDSVGRDTVQDGCMMRKL